MLALKLQKLTKRTLLRPSQLRFVQGSTIIIRTYKHGRKTIHNSSPHGKLPPLVPPVTHEKSPRVRSHERQGSNNRDSEEEFQEEDLSLGKLLVVGLLIITSSIIAGVVEIFLVMLAQKLGLNAPAPVLKDVRGVIEEKATWLDQYMREYGEKKPGGDDER